MKFSEIKYERPDLDSMKDRMRMNLQELNNATDAIKQIEIIETIYSDRAHFETMSNVANIRYTINTSDPFFEQEQQYFDTHYPIYQELISEFYKAIISSSFRNELEKISQDLQQRQKTDGYVEGDLNRIKQQLTKLNDTVKQFQKQIRTRFHREKAYYLWVSDTVATAIRRTDREALRHLSWLARYAESREPLNSHHSAIQYECR